MTSTDKNGFIYISPDQKDIDKSVKQKKIHNKIVNDLALKMQHYMETAGKRKLEREKYKKLLSCIAIIFMLSSCNTTKLPIPTLAKQCSDSFPCIIKDTLVVRDTNFIEYDSIIKREVKILDVLCDSAKQFKKVEIPVETIKYRESKTITVTKVVEKLDTAQLVNCIQVQDSLKDVIFNLNQELVKQDNKFAKELLRTKNWRNIFGSISLLMLLISLFVVWRLAKSVEVNF